MGGVDDEPVQAEAARQRLEVAVQMPITASMQDTLSELARSAPQAQEEERAKCRRLNYKQPETKEEKRPVLEIKLEKQPPQEEQVEVQICENPVTRARGKNAVEEETFGMAVRHDDTQCRECGRHGRQRASDLQPVWEHCPYAWMWRPMPKMPTSFL